MRPCIPPPPGDEKPVSVRTPTLPSPPMPIFEAETPMSQRPTRRP